MTIKHTLQKECPKCLLTKFMFSFVFSPTKSGVKLSSYCVECKNKRAKELRKLKNPNIAQRKGHSKETRSKLANIQAARPPISHETRTKLSQAMVGRYLGRPISEKQKNQISITLTGIPSTRKGPQSNLYIDGRSALNYSERQQAFNKPEYKFWRKSVYERDDYTCQICHTRGGDLEVDHIIPWAKSVELRYIISNGRTLCKKCHRQTPTYGVKSIKYK